MEILEFESIITNKKLTKWMDLRWQKNQLTGRQIIETIQSEEQRGKQIEEKSTKPQRPMRQH